MKSHGVLGTITSVLVNAAVLAAVPTVPALARQHDGTTTAVRQQIVSDFETMSTKFAELAEAMPAETYGWQPMEGVRTVSEVYMLIASENYFVPPSWGATPPEGIEMQGLFARMGEVTDKAEVVGHVQRGFEYSLAALRALTDDDMHRSVRIFGQEGPMGARLMTVLGDMHEHLGQAIAYARMNRVVPPWTARRQSQ